MKLVSFLGQNREQNLFPLFSKNKTKYLIFDIIFSRIFEKVLELQSTNMSMSKTLRK